MTIKTVLLASAAAFMFAAPALAQETPAPTAPAPAAAASSQQSLSLNPGMTVSGPDGELGKLEGVRNNAEGKQELTVRGADGQLRAVPLSGIRQENGGVVVAYTKAEYDAAAAIAGAPPAPAPAVDPAAAPTAPAADPMAQPTDPSAPPPTTAPDAAEPAPAPTEPN
ncbi:hypothetical protein SH203_02395 [Brevundimonas sp. SH203]|uniref:hypothetical protein n=1 Tax=Brevundimonas sp. SH203 TaxID=345167 RepID=UPI0009D43AA0|nr:hypothetical protein [Brevundimonas sp. SH203]GAW41983.1 hypothetical protein SH203_02395 [Brevundimonas sp. SH203]